MRTNIVIDDDLMNRVMKLTGIRTKREAVEMGLKALLRRVGLAGQGYRLPIVGADLSVDRFGRIVDRFSMDTGRPFLTVASIDSNGSSIDYR